MGYMTAVTRYECDDYGCRFVTDHNDLPAAAGVGLAVLLALIVAGCIAYWVHRTAPRPRRPVEQAPVHYPTENLPPYVPPVTEPVTAYPDPTPAPPPREPDDDFIVNPFGIR